MPSAVVSESSPLKGSKPSLSPCWFEQPSKTAQHRCYTHIGVDNKDVIDKEASFFGICGGGREDGCSLHLTEAYHLLLKSGGLGQAFSNRSEDIAASPMFPSARRDDSCVGLVTNLFMQSITLDYLGCTRWCVW